MASNPRRAVFTGMSVLTSLGNDLGAFRQNLLDGVSGVALLRNFDASAAPCKLASEVVDYDGKKFLPASARDARKSLNKMARTVQFGFTTAVKAWEDAGGPAKGAIDPFRFGVEYGCVMVATEVEDLAGGAKVSVSLEPKTEVHYDTWGREGLRLVPPQWMLKYLPNMPACHASIYCDAQGPNNTITSGDIASTLALGEAYRIIQRDLADAFLVGGCDSRLNPVSYARLSLFQQLTTRTDLGGRAVRPFAADRSGTVLGEGAAVFILEEREAALKRGARIDAELVSFASGFDRGLQGSVLAGVLRRALQQAGVAPAEVDHVNSSAGGTAKLDGWEARAIAEVFGPGMAVIAPKAQFGGLSAAAGLAELAVSVMALRHGVVAGYDGYGKPAADCPVAPITETRAATKPYAVKISTTDMGQCAVVVVRKGD